MEKTFFILFQIKTRYCQSLKKCKITYNKNENITIEDIKLIMVDEYPEWCISRYRWNSSPHKKTLSKRRFNYVVIIDFSNLKLYRKNNDNDDIMMMDNSFKIDDYEEGGIFFMRFENYNRHD